MALPTIDELETELLDLVKSVDAFGSRGFSVFDLDDFEGKAGAQLPTVGVSYDGAMPMGNEVTPTSATSAASMLAIQFVIVIAVQYSYTGQDDTKRQAFALLDQVRSLVLGYKGVNSRPWRFIGERPEAEASGDGVAFYSQVWQTTLPIIGNFNNS